MCMSHLCRNFLPSRLSEHLHLPLPLSPSHLSRPPTGKAQRLHATHPPVPTLPSPLTLPPAHPTLPLAHLTPTRLPSPLTLPPAHLTTTRLPSPLTLPPAHPTTTRQHARAESTSDQQQADPVNHQPTATSTHSLLLLLLLPLPSPSHQSPVRKTTHRPSFSGSSCQVDAAQSSASAPQTG